MKDEHMIVLYCSFIYHQCITDMRGFREFAEENLAGKFYYMDSTENDINDGFDKIK